MAFQVNTNVNALNAQAQASFNQFSMKSSLEKLSTGLRITKSADDASGMAIADTLRNQANTLGQSIKNANDGMGIIQIADKAMDEQVKILDTIKTKATQAAQDGQTTSSRAAIQSDINKLISGLDNIAGSTSYNGQSLLSGSYTNKKFQIDAYSNTTISMSIGATSSDKVGQVRLETTGMIAASGGASTSLKNVSLKFVDVDGSTDVTLESVKISTSAGTGLGVLAEVINKNSDKLGVKASFSVQGTGSASVGSGSLAGLVINNVTIGMVSDVKKNDSDGRLVAAINAVKDSTGVEASVDSNGRLNLTSTDGRAISIQSNSGAAGTVANLAKSAQVIFGGGDFKGISAATNNHAVVGRLSLVKQGGTDIKISGTNMSAIGVVSGGSGANITKMAQTSVNLRDVKGSFNVTVACAAGAALNKQVYKDISSAGGLGAGVTSLKGAMVVMDIADTAMKMLDRVRSDIGSTYNQFASTVSNITITQVNVKAAESNIRDVDFAQESANFSKLNILAQSGSYALSQANQLQQGVLRLLQ